MDCPGCGKTFRTRLATGVHITRTACKPHIVAFRRESARLRSTALRRREGVPERPRYTAEERQAHRAARRREWNRRHPRVHPPAEPLPVLHTGHAIFDEARAIVGPARSGLTVWLDPLHEELLSVAALAILEGTDPAAAVEAFRRSENRWRNLARPFLLDTSSPRQGTGPPGR